MHHLIVGVGVIVALFVLASRCGMSGSPPIAPGQGHQALQAVEQVPIPVVQQAAHDLIDRQATMLKTQVDTALKAWESLTPDQRRQLYAAIQVAVKELRIGVPSWLQGAQP